MDGRSAAAAAAAAAAAGANLTLILQTRLVTFNVVHEGRPVRRRRGGGGLGGGRAGGGAAPDSRSIPSYDADPVSDAGAVAAGGAVSAHTCLRACVRACQRSAGGYRRRDFVTRVASHRVHAGKVERGDLAPRPYSAALS